MSSVWWQLEVPGVANHYYCKIKYNLFTRSKWTVNEFLMRHQWISSTNINVSISLTLYDRVTLTCMQTTFLASEFFAAVLIVSNWENNFFNICNLEGWKEDGNVLGCTGAVFPHRRLSGQSSLNSFPWQRSLLLKLASAKSVWSSCRDGQILRRRPACTMGRCHSDN